MESSLLSPPPPFPLFFFFLPAPRTRRLCTTDELRDDAQLFIFSFCGGGQEMRMDFLSPFALLGGVEYISHLFPLFSPCAFPRGTERRRFRLSPYFFLFLFSFPPFFLSEDGRVSRTSPLSILPFFLPNEFFFPPFLGEVR